MLTDEQKRSIAAKDARYATLWGLPGPGIAKPLTPRRVAPPAIKAAAPCAHRSAEPARTEQCKTCRGKVELKVYGCGVHGECTIGKRIPGVPGCCDGCTSRRSPVAGPDLSPSGHNSPPPPDRTAPLVRPPSVTEIPQTGLVRTPDRGAFNGGHVRYQGRLLLAYRAGWAGSTVHVAEMNEDWTARRSVRLGLRHPECAGGCEDPRLFEHRGRLYVSFTGVWRRGKDLVTSQLYAVLRDDLTVEKVYCPRYEGRAWPKEKNWVFFSHGGDLYAVYSTHPKHVVLHVNKDFAHVVHEESYPYPWAGGFLRGGASPVLAGERYYHFTHGRRNHDNTSTYSVGVYAFEARPPFKPLGAVEHPLLWADAEAAKTLDRGNLAVVFPQGATLEGGRWTVTAGWNDNRLMRLTWNAADIDRALGLPHEPPASFTLRPDTSDRWVWDEVVARDEYGLASLNLAGREVLDIGGHVGTFAWAAHTRGAAVVHSYEPDPENFAVLAMNVELASPSIRPFRDPVWGRAGHECYMRPLWDEWNRGGREIGPYTADENYHCGWSVGIADVVRRCAATDPTGRIAVLKIDCEGAEADILPGLVRDPHAATLVDRIVGEWHHPVTLARLKEWLEPAGFTVSGRNETVDARGTFTAVRASD